MYTLNTFNFYRLPGDRDSSAVEEGVQLCTAPHMQRLQSMQAINAVGHGLVANAAYERHVKGDKALGI